VTSLNELERYMIGEIKFLIIQSKKLESIPDRNLWIEYVELLKTGTFSTLTKNIELCPSDFLSHSGLEPSAQRTNTH